ncbi:MAG: DUF3035 domain-containing protein [Pikeienuella sp.]|uniref:DUF3035 domain-containing protein n=1 Tax=Pikeienuella sp. TaxID=2831957 RepID=UPI00391C14BF
MRRPSSATSPRRSAALAAVVFLAGCSVSSERGGTIGEQLGVTAGAPDEFLIIARAPLEMPPSFDLPRPQPGAPSRLEPDPFVEAESALFGRPVSAERAGAQAPGSGETALLAGAGATGDNSAVRAALAGEAGPTERRFGLTSVFGVPIPQNLGEEDALLFSAEEMERLRQQGVPTPAAPPIVEEDGRPSEDLIGSVYRRN